MSSPRFIQIHTLHSYSAALLNRDDTGLAKRLPFGGSVRTRISSQCLKRHWRVSEDVHALKNIDGAASSIRSRNTIGRKVLAGLREKTSATEDTFNAVERAFQSVSMGRKATPKEGASRLLLGAPEVSYLPGPGPPKF